MELLALHAKTICAGIASQSLVIEFGAGSAEKVAPLLQALNQPAYIAIDISANHLKDSGKRLKANFPLVPMQGICADFSNLLDLPLQDDWKKRPRLGFFPGSSLGNFEPAEAENFLIQVKQLLGPSGLLLIGIDQPRQQDQLEAAYNDAAGISAAFARNLLIRLQRDLNINLNPDYFRYQAKWQSKQQRIAMALVSLEEQQLQILNETVIFKPGEAMITEYSYKYAPAAFQRLANGAGWRCLKRCCDAADTFSLHLLG
jgi:dimethylhistidine N-methyltransferase